VWLNDGSSTFTTSGQALGSGDGWEVALGDFGTFNLRVRACGGNTEEAAGAKNITTVIASFRPGKCFRDGLGAGIGIAGLELLRRASLDPTY